MDLIVGTDTFRPSTITSLLADAMEIKPGNVVFDIGCGSGILSIIAAKLGAGRVIAVDAADETVEVATSNAKTHGVDEVIEVSQGDMFDPVNAEVQADVIIGDVSGIPDLIASASGWFPSGLAGGPTGAELPIRMIEQAKDRIKRGGRMLLPTGTLQDENSILSKARSAFGNIRQLSERSIPLPSTLAEDPAVIQMVKDKIIALTQRGSRFLWTARVWEIRA